jgi:hypothetical protein
VSVTPAGTAVAPDVGAARVEDAAGESTRVGSVMARSHAAAKLTKKRNRKSLFGSDIGVRWRKARASSHAS